MSFCKLFCCTSLFERNVYSTAKYLMVSILEGIFVYILTIVWTIWLSLLNHLSHWYFTNFCWPIQCFHTFSMVKKISKLPSTLWIFANNVTWTFTIVSRVRKEDIGSRPMKAHPLSISFPVIQQACQSFEEAGELVERCSYKVSFYAVGKNCLYKVRNSVVRMLIL